MITEMAAIEVVDQIEPREDSGRRHMLFAYLVLREPLVASLHWRCFEGQPLSVSDMQVIAGRW